MFFCQVVFCLSRLFAAVGIVSPVPSPPAPRTLCTSALFFTLSSRPPSRDPGRPYARYCIALSPCHRHPRLRPPGFAYAPIGLRFGNPCKHGCAHLAPIVHIKCGMTVLSHRCTIVCAIVIPANASQGAGSAAGMTVQGACEGTNGKRRYVVVRWLVRCRIIRRPAGQRRARPKFILSEDGRLWPASL